MADVEIKKEDVKVKKVGVEVKKRGADVSKYLDQALAEAKKPMAAEEKRARVDFLKGRLPGYEKQFLSESKRLKEAVDAGDVAKAEGIRDVLEVNYRERKAIVSELRTLGETVKDRSDG